MNNIENSQWIQYLLTYLDENNFEKKDFQELNKDFFHEKYQKYPKEVIYEARISFKKNRVNEYENELEVTKKDMEKYTNEKKNEIINIVMRHTNYDRKESETKLLENNYHYEKVIKNYLEENKPKKESIEPTESVNQQIYKNLRVFLSDK